MSVIPDNKFRHLRGQLLEQDIHAVMGGDPEGIPGSGVRTPQLLTVHGVPLYVNPRFFPVLQFFTCLLRLFSGCISLQVSLQ